MNNLYDKNEATVLLHYMSLVRRFYPKRLTYSILWTIPTGAIWGEVSQGHNDMLTSDGNSSSSWCAGSFGSAHQEEPALSAPKRLFSLPHIIPFIIQSNVALF